MDLLSHAIRSIFYDVNVSAVAEDISKRKCSFLDDEFVQQTIWHAHQFTRSEIKALRDYVLHNAALKKSKSHNWYNCLNLLQEFTKDCLIDENNVPVLRFEKIQCWRELSLLLGEDILTTSFLANKNLAKKRLAHYAWPNVIHHDNERLNKILADGLTDIHAHLKASADIFELTWLDFMNNVTNRPDNYQSLYCSAEGIVVTSSRSFLDIKTMVQTAAYLRCSLFEALCRNHVDEELFKCYKYLRNERLRTSNLVKLQSRIDNHRKKAAMSYALEYPIDYALTEANSNEIYAIHEGERAMLYRFFREFYSKGALSVQMGDYMFLYLLLKARVRKEFIQTNSLSGFENFKVYEDRKSRYSNMYKKLYPLYAIQSSIRPGSSDRFEARVTPDAVPDDRFSKALFGEVDTYHNVNRESLTFVIHFIKNDGCSAWTANNPSRVGYSDKIRSQISSVIEDTRKRLSAKYPNGNIYDIVGIDAAGSELNCSPSVFGLAFRYARLCGLTNMTYHVGEDFYDLIDGLYAIDEAITFLDLQSGSRLGHAIALGVDAQKYYMQRNHEVVMTRQRLLDNIVWLLCNANDNLMPVAFKSELITKAQELYSSIGYKQPFNIYTIYLSQKLRSDGIDNRFSLSLWSKASKCMDSKVKEARQNPNAIKINRDYLYVQRIKDKGNEVVLYKYDTCISALVSDIQRVMRDRIVNKGIAIETNPSSNLKIGPINAYEEEPLFAFVDHGIMTTVNTDDKGIFATSLYNEFSLTAYACLNKGISEYRTLSIVRELKSNAEYSRFKVNDLHLIAIGKAWN